MGKLRHNRAKSSGAAPKRQAIPMDSAHPGMGRSFARVGPGRGLDPAAVPHMPMATMHTVKGTGPQPRTALCLRLLPDLVVNGPPLEAEAWEGSLSFPTVGRGHWVWGQVAHGSSPQEQ